MDIFTVKIELLALQDWIDRAEVESTKCPEGPLAKARLTEWQRISWKVAGMSSALSRKRPSLGRPSPFVLEFIKVVPFKFARKTVYLLRCYPLAGWLKIVIAESARSGGNSNAF